MSPVEQFFAHVGTKVRFTDDQMGIECRMLIAAYGEMLTDMAKSHAPISEMRQTVQRITAILAAGIDHLLDHAETEDITNKTSH